MHCSIPNHNSARASDSLLVPLLGLEQSFCSLEAWDKCMEYGVMNCVECGSCVYVCPAKRNIVQYIRNAKAQVKAQQQAAKAKAEAK